MARVEGGGVFVDGPSVAAFESSPGVTELHWNGWGPLRPLDGLGPDERARVHAANLASRRRSVDAFAAFVDRWRGALRRCRTEEEVVALGRPARPAGPAEPGAARGERADLDAIDARVLDVLRDALAEAGRVRDRLAGRRSPLDVDVEVKVGLRIQAGPVACAAAASAAGGVEAGCRAAAGGAAGLDADGAPTRAVAAGPVSVTVAGDRIDSVELARGPAYARLGRSSVAAGLGGQRTLAVAPGGARLSAEARLGVELRLLDAETVRRALSGQDEWAKRR
jgi:hypothetical protein